MICTKCGDVIKDEALNWYLAKAEELAKCLGNANSSGLLAVTKELALDNGNRARRAINAK